jgi:hypothetical protein
LQHLRQGNRTTALSRRHQWGHRLGKIIWVDLVSRKLSILQTPQKFHVAPATGTKRFHRQRVPAGFPQMMEQKSGEKGFTDAGVRARDEENSGRPLRRARFHSQ